MTLGRWGHYGCVKITAVVTLGPWAMVTLGPWLHLGHGDIRAVP